MLRPRTDKSGSLAVAQMIGGVVLELRGLDRLAVHAALGAVAGLVAVAENHVLFQHAFRQIGHRACSGAFALRGRTHVGLACVRHDSLRWVVSLSWADPGGSRAAVNKRAAAAEAA